MKINVKGGGYSLYELVITLAVGALFGTSQPGEAARRWNWRSIMNMPLNE